MTRRVLWLALLAFSARAGAATIDDVEGHYVGTWTNNTFIGSTGAVTIDMDIVGSQITATFLMGGSILGGFLQPAPLQLVGTITGGDAVFNAAPGGPYGTVAGTIHGATGAFEFALSMLQNPSIVGVTVTGTIVNHVMNLDYDVTIMEFGVAEGVLEAPEPSAVASALAATGVLSLLRARTRGFA